MVTKLEAKMSQTMRPKMKTYFAANSVWMISFICACAIVQIAPLASCFHLSLNRNEGAINIQIENEAALNISVTIDYSDSSIKASVKNESACKSHGTPEQHEMMERINATKEIDTTSKEQIKTKKQIEAKEVMEHNPKDFIPQLIPKDRKFRLFAKSSEEDEDDEDDNGYPYKHYLRPK